MENKSNSTVIRPSINNETESLSLIHSAVNEKDENDLQDSIKKLELKTDIYKMQMPPMNQVCY